MDLSEVGQRMDENRREHQATLPANPGVMLAPSLPLPTCAVGMHVPNQDRPPWEPIQCLKCGKAIYLADGVWLLDEEGVTEGCTDDEEWL